MAVTQIKIESLAKKLARVRRSMAHNFTPTIEQRFDKLNQAIEALPLGQQLAVSVIATRIEESR